MQKKKLVMSNKFGISNKSEVYQMFSSGSTITVMMKKMQSYTTTRSVANVQTRYITMLFKLKLLNKEYCIG